MLQLSRTSSWCLECVCVEGWGAASTLHLWARLKEGGEKKSGMHVLRDQGNEQEECGHFFSVCVCGWECFSVCRAGPLCLSLMCKACGQSANMAIMRQKLSSDCRLLLARANAAVIYFLESLKCLWKCGSVAISRGNRAEEFVCMRMCEC